MAIEQAAPAGDEKFACLRCLICDEEVFGKERNKMIKKLLSLSSIFLVFLLICFRLDFGSTGAMNDSPRTNLQQVALGIQLLEGELSFLRPDCSSPSLAEVDQSLSAA